MRGQVDAPAGDRFDRAAGARGGARALRRQGRSSTRSTSRTARRRPTRAHDAGAQVRRRGDRADHRRGRAWPRTREDKLAHRPPPGRVRLRPLRPAAVRPADRPADLHDLHRQRGRPQARPVDAGGDRGHPRASSPSCQIILGLSNISFGLNPAARHVLNSVFLDHALRRGLTGAIVHVSARSCRCTRSRPRRSRPPRT